MSWLLKFKYPDGGIGEAEINVPILRHAENGFDQTFPKLADTRFNVEQVENTLGNRMYDKAKCVSILEKLNGE